MRIRTGDRSYGGESTAEVIDDDRREGESI